jgi:mRNA interferase RelE/StbE
MTFKLRFHEKAWREWQQLDASVREPLKNKLLERLEQPRVPASALRGMPNCYKIKLHSAGYRLVYRVDDVAVYVTVIAVGNRDKSRVYQNATQRL